MITLLWFLAFIAIFIVLAYNRASLIIWTASLTMFLVFDTIFHRGLSAGMIVCWVVFLLVFIPLNIIPLRRQLITKPFFNFFKKVTPTMSRTEREAISAGTVTWEADLFRGNPDWNKLLNLPAAKLTAEEQAFLDGPVNTLCSMLNDWDITHNRADLPEEVWRYLKEQGFFSLIIPKKYGGKQFSAYAHSRILIKVSGKCITASSTISVPNSLGPAELILEYGTDWQKEYYLPRLARGEEIPCFALTSPTAGSDAGSMVDHGIVCRGEFEGKETIGIKLNFDKRYITLAPIATVVGLAFKLYDPENLIGNKYDIGITCALLPRNTKGMTIGRRHFPVNTPFQNGPIQGNDVFIPLDWIIGGVKQAGKGWGMLMECLAAGRAISLPSSAVGGAKVSSYVTGAYARIRRQFNVPIGKFEGVQEFLARIASYTYIVDAATTFSTAAIDAGAKPSVASAIVKYHITEMSRKIGLDGMDIHGGKGIMLGPNNYIGRGYEAMPIAITVEGANILTRNLIIFGQGAIRCHPYVLKEMEAAKNSDAAEGLKAFDTVLFKHIGFGISNTVRSFILGITSSIFVQAPAGKLRRYYQQSTRFSSSFAFLADVCMLYYGGKLKRKESISARLGDILSYLYLLSSVLKYYHDQGEMKEDLPVVRHAALTCLFEIQERFDEILKNFRSRILAWMLKIIIFPIGERFSKPRDLINRKVAQLIFDPTSTRDRLSRGAYTANEPNNLLAQVQDAFIKSIAAEPVEKIIKAAKKEGKIDGFDAKEQARNALHYQIISKEEYEIFMQAETARMKVIHVDDFSNEELRRT